MMVHLNALSQIKFEKGYIIDNHDEKITCYIKNNDWENNPDTFQYRFGMSGELLLGTLSEIKEFGIDSGATFIAADVPIDYAIADLKPTSADKNPVWVQQRLFLRVVVNGLASLYEYKRNQFTQFYLRRASGDIIPLIHKNYLGEQGKVETNLAYRQQLWNELSCKSLGREYIARLRYKKEDLTMCFLKYSACKDSSFVLHPSTKRTGQFNMMLHVGIDYTRYKPYVGIPIGMNHSLKHNLTFRFGAGLEYIAPFNKGKWALLLEPTYQHYKVKSSSASVPNKPIFWAIEAPIGIRYYLFLNDNLKGFLNVHYVAKIYARQFKADWFGTDHIYLGNNLAIGSGITKNIFSAEFRYTADRKVFV
ncbi:MAG: hypothetical protein ABIN80_03320 [Dyadobacter sp.]|uniref:hypothetical protein n=1 Tax=Dyadobacter sp. TaxID=1914288 RepID=UPI003264F776